MYWNKTLKRLLICLVVLLALGLASLEIFAQLYREKAGAYFRSEFARQSDLVLQPFTTTVSVWRHFPRVTFSFNQISLVDTAGHQPVQVLFIKRASVAVPLSQFRPDRLKISRVDLEDLSFYERVDSNGTKAGLRFRQVNNPDTTASRLPFVIPVITIRNGRIKSENLFKKSSYAFYVDQANLVAQLKSGKLNLQGPIQGKINHISNKRISFLRNKPFTFNLHYNYLLNQKKGFFTKSNLLLNQDSIHILGWHIRLPEGKGSQLNVTLKGRQPLLYVIRQLLPAPAQPLLEQIKTNSRMQFTYHLTGTSGPKISPRNRINFTLQNGTFYLPASKSYIKAVSMRGIMDNGARHNLETSHFRIADLTARTSEGQIQLQLQVDNFVRPNIWIKSQGRITLKELAGLVHLPFTSVAEGTLAGAVDFRGQLPDTLRTSVPNWQGQGAVRVENASFRPLGLKVNCQNVTGEIRFTNKLLQLVNLGGTIAGKPFNLQASVNNYLAYLLQTPGSINANANIYISRIDTDWLDLDGLARPTKTNQPKSSRKTAIEKKNANGRKSGPPNTKEGNTQINYAAASPPDVDNWQRTRMQVNMRVAAVNLPGKEQVKNLVVQVNQTARNIKLTQMRFTTNGGGTATANGGFALTTAGIQNPYLNVSLYYPFINLQQFMLDLAALKKDNAETQPTVTRSGSTQKQNQFIQEQDYRLNLQLRANRLEYLYLKGTNLNLQANLNRHRAKLTKLRVNAFGGQLNARGEMVLDAPENNLPVHLRTQVNNVNLQQLFALAENMQLDVLGSQNIKGTAQCNLNVTTTLDKTFSPSFAGTVAYVQARFQNLELIGVEPIQHALRFLRDERTQHLYFEDVSTSFIMKDTHFITPRLPLNSNLTAFELSGTYTMGGSANLNMDVNVLSVLFGNNKRRIQKIQSDSLALNTRRRKQHLFIFREQNKYKVKLSNRQDREEKRKALRQQFSQYLRQHQIDTVFTMNR